ncbi:MAG: chemotaxis response regulator protein-glutamate methylesterase [Methylophilales bacterium]|nr:chemotaxis response regulator protein-glutamate methylesterase [Methylophilales bacterium]
MNKIKVLVVDDSATIRAVLKQIINKQADMEVVGMAEDGFVATEMLRITNPDVITLDVEMPRMNGLDFLEQLMQQSPTPVLMISSFTDRHSEATLRALELGAIDFVSKPRLISDIGMEEYADEIVSKIRAAATAKLHQAQPQKMRLESMEKKQSTNITKPTAITSAVDKILVFGASTGGTEALKEVLINLPGNAPGILIAQHMPEGFTKSFAERLNSLCQISVKEAEHGDRILPGHAYLAPGHSHLLIGRSGTNYVCELSQTSPVNRHRPSVDVLYRSVANNVGKNAIGIILTGMGKDGAAGMKELKAAGAYTFAQDEASCVVFGMPKEAIAQGGIDEIVPLKEMAKRILSRLSLEAKVFQI